MRNRRAVLSVLIASLVAGFVACSDNPSGVTNPPPPPPTGPIVSNPTRPQSAALASPSVTPASMAGDSIVFVSLASGSVPQGYRAVVRNMTRGLSVTALMVDGGFDPVPLVARVGDSIQ